MRRAVAGLLLAMLVGACTTSTASDRPERVAASSPAARPESPASAQPSPSPAVPSTADAGEADPPAPERRRFAGRISAVPAALEREMRGTTWKPGCPVPLSDLRLLRFNHVGFDGQVKRGRMVVNSAVAENVLWVFRQLFEARFPMKRVDLAREFELSRWEERRHSRRSVTASFNCRVVITPAGPGRTFSQHSYGLAIDINPLQNPYVRGDGWVRNRHARPYVDRSNDLPGMIHDGDVVVRSFAAIGWAWGGRWSGGKDYMHFSVAAR